MTVIRDAAGRYFASFVVSDDRQPLSEVDAECGIDLGLKYFAVLDDGTKVTAPGFLRRAEKKLKRAQKDLSRKEKGSKNREKARAKYARAQTKVADARRNFHHQLSTKIICENQAVYVEDLAVKALGRTRLAKSAHDAGWSTFVGMLEYKADLYGRCFAKVGRFFPSSRMCSNCGRKDGPKRLHVRKWECLGCGAAHDRDVNAALNIRREGQRIVAAGRKPQAAMPAEAETQNARGGSASPPPTVMAAAGEAGSHRGAA